MHPDSERYWFDRLLSENSLSQSWQATRRESPTRCFLKVPSDSNELTLEVKNRILRRSYQLQSRLRVGEILTAAALFKESGVVIVEYPYLDPEDLEELTALRLLDNDLFGLVRLAAIVDYVHLQNIVHLDLKLDNFRFLRSGSGPRLRLLDLDNIETAGHAADHLVSGTPGHIAPEVVNNDRVTARSDLYSIGRSIELALESARSDTPSRDSRAQIDRLEALVDSLTKESPSERPELMLDALKDVGLIDDSRHRDALKSVLSMQLLSRIRELADTKAYAEVNLKQDLFQAVNLFSLPDDLVADLQAGMMISPRSSLRCFRDVMARSQVSRLGDFWHVDISDEVLVETFLELDRLLGTAIGVDDKTVGERVDGGESSDGPMSLKTYLLARHHLEQDGDDGDRAAPGQDVLERLSDAAASLGRPREAAELLEQLIPQLQPDTGHFLDALLRLVRFEIGANRLPAAREFTERGIETARRQSDRAAELRFQRHAAWLIARVGDLAQARTILQEVIDGAAALGQDVEKAKAYGDLAAVELHSGKLDEAMRQYDACLELAVARGLETEIAATFCNYGTLCFELGDYTRSIELSKQSMRYLNETDQRDLLPYIYQNIASCYTRLGEYRRADHWSGRCLNHLQLSPDHLSCANFYIYQGWSQMVRGQLDEAEESLNRSLMLDSSESARRGTAVGLRNLAEIALYRGDVEKCASLIDRAREILDTYPMKVLAAELSLIEAIQGYYYFSSGLEAIGDVCRTLADLGCAYYTAYAFTLLLIEGDADWWASHRELCEHLPDFTGSSRRAPLFQAMNHLLDTVKEDRESEQRIIESVKNAYRILETSGHVFLAVQACALIARLYFCSRRPRLGVRFQKQARALSDSITNSRLAERYGSYVEEREAADQGRNLLLSSLRGVAEVLASLDSEESPLQKVLQFAVDTVEAERGVLLLKNQPNEKLRIKAYVNCDETSLKDIVDYSQNIPKNTLASASPIFVLDALSDDRTKRFKSIVAHNIRSVICVPIVVGGRTEGVIYLDHQTIPALFDKGDLEFVQSLAKFVSLIYDTVMRHDRNRQYTSYLENGLAEMGVEPGFITRNETVRRLLGEVRRSAESNMSVLVTGESGTGKEIVCRLIHAFSPRKDGPFVKLNCASLAESLAESELFGVADKTATGVRARPGKFEAADGGTLFLDEIGDMPLALQAKVLRALENQEFERVGSNKSVFTDIRFVFATNRSLSDMVDQKAFRQDLYYRVCVVEFRIPPLRERPDDIPLLIEHFSRVFCPGRSRPIEIAAPAMKMLESYSWPGNVRELRNLVESLTILHTGMTIQLEDLPGQIIQEARGGRFDQNALEVREKAKIEWALRKNNGNQSAAARLIGMSLSSLRRRIKKYRIRLP